MDAIKKKMQAMKMEKDAAMDKADTCEGQAKDANARADKVKYFFFFFLFFSLLFSFSFPQVNEEVRELAKKLSQIEADLQRNKNDLEQANKNLEEKEKLLTSVSTDSTRTRLKLARELKYSSFSDRKRSGCPKQKSTRNRRKS